MKINKIYKSLFNELLKGNCRKFEMDSEHVFISPDGFHGFVFCKKDVPFNLEMYAESKQKLDLVSAVKEENLCELTNHYVSHKHVGFARILKQGVRKIYVNTKFLQDFEDYTDFYQAEENQIIVAVECDQIVGAFMPIRWTGSEE